MEIKIKVFCACIATTFLLQLSCSPILAAAEEYRQCTDGEVCEIGEFLFNDDYSPNTNATCTLTSRDPQGNIHLNAAAMSSNVDGWYSYPVITNGEAYGLYRSQICCATQTETICLDKSFEIASSSAGLSQTEVATAVWDASTADHAAVGSFGENLQAPNALTAAAVWDYPQRSLTSFGTLVSDIWEYSTRSVNSVSSLISGIWSHSDRTITDATLDDGELATKNQVEAITTTATTLDTNAKAELSQQVSNIEASMNNNRYFLEQLVNAPIIETFMEEGQVVPSDLQSKITETKKIAKFLSRDVVDLEGQILALNSNWEGTTYQNTLSEVSSASKVLGVSTQESLDPETVNSRVVWLSQKWKSPVISNLSVQTTSAISNASGINREIKSYGKTFISKQYLDIAGEHVEKIKQLIGSEGDPKDTDTLFGYIATLEAINTVLVQESLHLSETLEQWQDLNDTEKDARLDASKKKILAVNQIPDTEGLLRTKAHDKKHRENLALALQGLINSNLILLAMDANAASQNTWLEHGSVIFRSLVTNPSDILEQKIKIKYYLPTEVKSEHIMNIENGLTTVFDAEKNSLFVAGEVTLKPGESKTLVVEVIDVWVIKDEELQSIQKQTDTLFDSLKNTSYFAQGATIKADIEANLDKIKLLRANNQTPEVKIRSHREAMLELDSAKSKLENLKTIVTSAGSVGTLFGFVGGVQIIAVWGLVIILVAGFVFLLIYLKMIARAPVRPAKEVVVAANNTHKKEPTIDDKSIMTLIKEILVLKFSKPHTRLIFALFLIIILLLSAMGVFLYTSLSKPENSTQATIGIKDIPTSTSTPTPAAKPTSSSSGQLSSEEATKSEQAPPTIGESEASTSSATILGTTTTSEERLVVARIPSGFTAINVRVEPNKDSELVGRLYINQKVLLVQERDDWALIKTTNQNIETPIVGWILMSFISEIE